MGRLIDAVELTPLKIIELASGNVMQSIRRDSAGFRDFGEAYFSLLAAGATKAWRRHRRMTLNLTVPVGHVAVAVVDEASRAARRYDLGPRNYCRLTVPPGLWTGFRSLANEQCVVLNVADILHDPSEVDKAGEGAFPFDWNAVPYPAGADQEWPQ